MGLIDVSDIGNLNPVCGENLGGLNYLRIIPAENVLMIPKAKKGIVPAELVLKDGANYLDIFFDQANASFKEPMAVEENGEYCKPQIEVYVAKDTPEVNYFISRLQGIRCIALYKDGNNMAKVVGNLGQPLVFSSALEIENGKNGFTLTFSGEVEERAYFYTMMEVTPAGTRKHFSSGFTFGFLRS